MQSRVFFHFRAFRLLLVLLLATSGLLLFGADSLPKPTGYVNDFAHVVSPEDQNKLELFCGRVERELGVQFALVTINSLNGQPVEDYAIQLARQWGVGDKKNNQGVLLLLAIQDRKSDIETGRGIEPLLGDGFSGGILRSLRPDLRSGNYGAALITAAHDMARQIAQSKGIAFQDDAPVPERRPVDDSGRHGFPGWLVIAGIFFVLWLLGRGGRRGGRGGGSGGSGIWTGLLLGSLLGRGMGGGSRGNWGGGGGFGGGGGGGFGGFGGGDFGGGGANSNW